MMPHFKSRIHIQLSTNMRMKFGDMPDGTHFTDGTRKFIKLQTVLPSGATQTYKRVVLYEGSESMLPFNCVELDGHCGYTPNHVEFELL